MEHDGMAGGFSWRGEVDDAEFRSTLTEFDPLGKGLSGFPSAALPADWSALALLYQGSGSIALIRNFFVGRDLSQE